MNESVINGKYTFPESQNKPGYLNIVDTTGMLVGEMWGEPALVVLLMYDNLYKRNPRLANEFMYGYVLGMTHALMYADKYPKFSIVKEGAVTKMTVIDPVLGKVFEGTPARAPGAAKAAHEMVDKALRDGSKDN